MWTSISCLALEGCCWQDQVTCLLPGLLSLIPSALTGEAHVCACLPPHATPTPHHRKPTCPLFLALGTPGSEWTPQNMKPN